MLKAEWEINNVLLYLLLLNPQRVRVARKVDTIHSIHQDFLGEHASFPRWLRASGLLRFIRVNAHCKHWQLNSWYLL